MSRFWKTTTILALLAGIFSACQTTTPAISPIPPSATPSPSPTPTIGRIAFYSTTGPWQTGKSDIYLINADGSSLKHLTSGASPSWSPDGEKIAFGVWIIDASDNTEKKRLIDINAGSLLAWSRDGKKVAFADTGSIYIVDVQIALNGDTKDALKPIVNKAVYASDLSWSPDGKQLFFSYQEDEDSPHMIAQLDIAAATVETREWMKWKTLTQGWTPTWSPDGKKIAYQFDGNIYTMDVDGSNNNAVTTAGRSLAPIWSPDGRKILFQAKRDGNWEIYTIDADGNNEKNLTNNPASDYSPLPTFPSWSPDGKQIAFVSDRDGNQEIYVMDADGSHLLRLTNNDVDDSGPVWQPMPPP